MRVALFCDGFVMVRNTTITIYNIDLQWSE